MKTLHKGWKARCVAAVTVAATAAALVAGPADATSQGTNYCVNQGHNIYSSATFNSTVIGWMPYAGVWHHYTHSGNWSLGYVQGVGNNGYVPLGILAEDIGNTFPGRYNPSAYPYYFCPYH